MSPKTHRELYPSQYRHPLCGKTVRNKKNGTTFKVERVVNTRFGQLAIDPANPSDAWAVNDLEVVADASPPNTLHYRRVGDFAEFEGNDAIAAVELFGIVRTSRSNPDGKIVALAGIELTNLAAYEKYATDRGRTLTERR